jgi:hypothetical protein
MEAPLLINAIPELAEELTSLLDKPGLFDVAEQVARLSIVDRCRCGEDSCATFYTAPRSAEAWGAGHENIPLSSESGLLVLDLLNRKIVCVEVLDRSEIKEKLDKILPIAKVEKRT